MHSRLLLAGAEEVVTRAGGCGVQGLSSGDVGHFSNLAVAYYPSAHVVYYLYDDIACHSVAWEEKQKGFVLLCDDKGVEWGM
jgi:hypothetical protein